MTVSEKRGYSAQKCTFELYNLCTEVKLAKGRITDKKCYSAVQTGSKWIESGLVRTHLQPYMYYTCISSKLYIHKINTLYTHKIITYERS